MPLGKIVPTLLSKQKAKRKAKRDGELLALYRDWPPDLVDTFIVWDNLQPWDAGYMSDAPEGYPEWHTGWSYADYQTKPHMGVRMRRYL